MDHVELGQRLRARRAALGRTVASVATEAGLSVPYVANLENGRGNPTVDALDRLAGALGTRLTLTLADPNAVGREAPTPPSLLEFAKGGRFGRECAALAAALNEEEQAVRTTLLATMTAVGGTLRRDLGEADWQRLLDALVLILAHPAD
ncbi:helix-turn-helix transcriptional regulator [Nonomuraea sp. NPDC005650]|uniref:helix-turn-helix domain-containing protein n=1 Tax=Nonomuraea sp. NPDC005650 TaxID=3157045 RepID=UPI0033B22699